MAVPVDAEVVGGEVDDVHHHRVAVTGLDLGAWELPVHRRDHLTLPQPLHAQVAHLYVCMCVVILHSTGHRVRYSLTR